MQHLDLCVIQQARSWLEQSQTVWMCTVLATYGSAPREPGSLFAVNSEGRFSGSLSGGCVEEDFLERLAHGEFSDKRQFVRYGDGGLAPTLKLPCGSVLEILVERLTSECTEAQQLNEIEQALLGQRAVLRVVPRGEGDTVLDLSTGPSPRVQIDPASVRILIGPVRRILIAGISPVAECCARLALGLGYEVVVCDPRIELHETFDVAGVALMPILPARYIANGGCHAGTAVVALTHDPRLDDPTLMEAVRTDAFYIGAMGSRRTSERRLERLKRVAEIERQALARIHAPIGLALGSKTPAEIALAVMADILRVSNGVARDAL